MSSAVVSPVATPAEQLAALSAALDESERQIRAAVRLVGQLAGTGVCEQVEGLPLELFVSLRHGMPQGDARMLCTVAEVLAHMPATAVLFEQGDLSWGQVRRIVSAVRRLRVEHRAEVDERIAATVDERGGVDAYGPDGLVDAVDDAVAEIRERNQRKPKDPGKHNFIAFQQQLVGGAQFHGEGDDVSTAIILNALHDAAGPPAGAGDAVEPDQPTVRGRQLFEGLVKVCSAWLGGGSGKPAQPLFVTHIDVNTPDLHGVLEQRLRGKAPRIPAAVLDLLARDADFQTVLFDGSRPLAVSDKIHARTLPTDIEIAIRARDLGCRFPGSRDPVGFADNHHVAGVRNGHHPDLVVKLSRRNHKRVHDHGWNITLDGHTGTLTAKRKGRLYRSLPRGTPLSRPPRKPPLLDDDRAPPDMPF